MRKPIVAHCPVVVVQQITVHWTKLSRGGMAAVRRNALSEAFKVPLDQIGQAERGGLVLLHHSLYLDEYRAFVPKEKITVNPMTRPLALGCVTVDGGAEQTWASFIYNGHCGGAPNRVGMQQTLFMGVGEWGQIAYNGRFAPDWDGGWWYEKTVVNVGLFESPSNGIFTRSAPNRRFLAMGHLI